MASFLLVTYEMMYKPPRKLFVSYSVTFLYIYTNIVLILLELNNVMT